MRSLSGRALWALLWLACSPPQQVVEFPCPDVPRGRDEPVGELVVTRTDAPWAGYFQLSMDACPDRVFVGGYAGEEFGDEVPERRMWSSRDGASWDAEELPAENIAGVGCVADRVFALRSPWGEQPAAILERRIDEGWTVVFELVESFRETQVRRERFMSIVEAPAASPWSAYAIGGEHLVAGLDRHGQWRRLPPGEAAEAARSSPAERTDGRDGGECLVRAPVGIASPVAQAAICPGRLLTWSPSGEARSHRLPDLLWSTEWSADMAGSTVVLSRLQGTGEGVSSWLAVHRSDGWAVARVEGQVFDAAELQGRALALGLRSVFGIETTGRTE